MDERKARNIKKCGNQAREHSWKNVQKAEVRTGIKYGFQMTNTFESTKMHYQFRYFTSKMGVLNYATNARWF